VEGSVGVGVCVEASVVDYLLPRLGVLVTFVVRCVAVGKDEEGQRLCGVGMGLLRQEWRLVVYGV